MNYIPSEVYIAIYTTYGFLVLNYRFFKFTISSLIRLLKPRDFSSVNSKSSFQETDSEPIQESCEESYSDPTDLDYVQPPEKKYYLRKKKLNE
jgi:hypothetical protein